VFFSIWLKNYKTNNFELFFFATTAIKFTLTNPGHTKKPIIKKQSFIFFMEFQYRAFIKTSFTFLGSIILLITVTITIQIKIKTKKKSHSIMTKG